MNQPPHRIFVDTSAWFAILNPEDERHQIMSAAYSELLQLETEIVTSNTVVGESFTMLRSRVKRNPNLAFQFLKMFQDTQYIQVLFVDQDLEERAYRWLTQYSDHLLSFVDATSFACMESYGIDAVFTLDKDFVTAGFQIHPFYLYQHLPGQGKVHEDSAQYLEGT